MPFITYTFPEEPTGTGDTLQLVVKFFNTDTDENYDAVDFGIIVDDYGSSKIAYDLDDPLMAPNEWNFRLIDPNETLYFRFFPEPSAETFDPAAYIELYFNGQIDFKGRLSEDSINYDQGDRVYKLKALPQTDIINKQRIYKLDGDFINPMGYTSEAEYSYIRFIEDIYKLVNSDISYSNGKLKIIHPFESGAVGWNFYGEKDILTGEFSIFQFIDLYAAATYYYFRPSSGLQTVGDVLRHIAFHFGCFTGLVHEDRAFFKKLYTFNQNNQQSLGTINNREIFYKFNLFDYIRFNVTPIVGPIIKYEAGFESNLEGRYINQNMSVFFYTNHAVSGTYSVIGAYLSGNRYSMRYLADLDFQFEFEKDDFGATLAKYWHNYRSQFIFSRVHRFDVSGLDYDFLKDFQDNGNKFQPIALEKKYDEGRTIIDAVRLP